MDRRRPLLTLGAAALACTHAAAEAPLRAGEWLSPSADAVAALTMRPPECLAIPDDPDAALAVELGRAAFRTPLLLGGQGARAGLSCNSCHINGHGNPDFLFPGLSDAPGTADVTSSLMSEVRGDGEFNPKPIPTLTGAAAPIVARDADGALELFIHGLVVDEFAGAQPAPAVLAGLASYVRALSPDACMGTSPEPVTVAADMSDARRALFTAQRTLARGDGPAGTLMLAALRSKLGEMDERFAGPDLAPEREALRTASARLGEIRVLAAQDPAAAHAALAGWPARLTQIESRLVAAEARSLYAPGVLAAAFEAGD